MDLNQITLGARDFEASVGFYKLLGLRPIVMSEGRYARFELPTGSATLSLDHDPDYRAGGATIYFEVEDVDSRYLDLREAGVTFDTPPTDEPWLWREARLRDPAGNRLCLFHGGGNRRFPPWRIDQSNSAH